MQAQGSAIEESGAVGIRSFEKGVHLLQALRSASAPMRLTELASASGMTPSAARGYMVSLIRTGLASQDAATGRYDLGEQALQLGLAALRRTDFLQLAQVTLASLADASGQTALLAVWSPDGPVVVAKTEGRRTSVYEVRIGTRVTLTGTATGQIFMAYRAPADWEHLLPSKRIATELGPVLETIRHTGLAQTRPVTLPDRRSMSVPVFDHSGSLRGALTLIAREEGSGADMGDETGRLLRDAASGLSRRLGYAPTRR